MNMYKKVMIAWAVVMSIMASRVAAADVTATTVAVGDSIMTLSQVVATGLPVLCVETVDHEEPTCQYVSAPAGSIGRTIRNATKVPGRMTIYQRIDGVDSLMYDSGDYEKDVSGMTIKIRGNSSAYYDKKPYKIKLQKKRDLLFRGSLQQLLIEKGACGDKQGTQGKACADVVRRVGENLRVQIPVAVQKRRSTRRTFVGQQRGRAGNQHADRRDQTEQEENPDKQNR